MPIPIILGALGIGTAIGGIASAVKGGRKLYNSKAIMKEATRINDENSSFIAQRLNPQQATTTSNMDYLGRKELDIFVSFSQFSEILEKIQNKPEFPEYSKNGYKIPKYDPKEVRDVYVFASTLLGGIGGLAAGILGGLAAGGMTTTAVMALGTAGTGAAIAGLHGIAATNAILTVLGGGTLAAHGGGVALGSLVFCGATLGAFLLVSGLIFNFTGSKTLKKANEALEQVQRAERTLNNIYRFLKELNDISCDYMNSLTAVNDVYQKHFTVMRHMVLDEGKTNWFDYNDEEQLLIQNTVLLVQLLLDMCRVKIVLEAPPGQDVGVINQKEINIAKNKMEDVLNQCVI